MQALKWKVEKRAETTVVAFEGTLTESADFSALVDGLHGSVTFDLAGVRRINSEGVRLWVNFVRKLAQSLTELNFIRCSLPFVAQLNMIRGFSGGGNVKSLYAPYMNERTEEIEEKLLQVSGLNFHDPPSFDTPEGRYVFDDIPESYFAFFIESDIR